MPARHEPQRLDKRRPAGVAALGALGQNPPQHNIELIRLRRIERRGRRRHLLGVGDDQLWSRARERHLAGDDLVGFVVLFFAGDPAFDFFLEGAFQVGKGVVGNVELAEEIAVDHSVLEGTGSPEVREEPPEHLG